MHQRWPAEAAPLPALTVLTQFISVLYQASLLFEKGRPVAAPDCLAIVVSQDGNVQFVHNQAGQVVFWDQLSF